MISTANLVVAIARTYIGANPNGNKHERALYNDIIATFNTIKPHGLTMKRGYAWCAAGWSAWQIMAGNTAKDVALSASCSYLISDSKKLDIWKENESIIPLIGWGCVYDWQDGANYKTTDNKGDPDHVGIIVDVDKAHNQFTVCEANKGTNGICGLRVKSINGQNIRGFIAPKYAELKKSAYKPTKPYAGKIPATTIHYASKGEDAKALQSFLNWCIDAKLTVDGQFGRASTNALIVWQYTYGLNPDGFFGDISRKMANQIISAHKETTEKPVVKKPYSGTFPTLDKKVVNVQKELAKVGNDLSYTTNTKEADYPKGHPKASYKKALTKLPMSGHRWNAWARKGASCDVGQWTNIRTAFSNLGIKSDIPVRAGLWYLISWLDKTGHFKRVPVSDAQEGDIGAYRKDTKTKRGHIFMCYATLKKLAKNVKGKVKEASAKQYYPKTVNGLRTRLSSSKKKWVKVWRAVNIVIESPLKKGSKGDNVKNLQKYLNWYFRPKYKKDVLKVDGDFGSITENYVKLFQSEQKLSATGKVDAPTIKAMKGVIL